MNKVEIKITKYELESADVVCLDTLCELYKDYLNDAENDRFKTYLINRHHMDYDSAEYLEDVIYKLH